MRYQNLKIIGAVLICVVMSLTALQPKASSTSLEVQVSIEPMPVKHLRPGSIRVKVGEQVRKGQVLASLGGSGSVSSGPHLHFHVADGNSPLGAEGLPFVFAHFDQLGAFPSIGTFGSGQPWVAEPGATASQRTMEFPMMLTVVQFGD
jgi:Peptidase family M23